MKYLYVNDEGLKDELLQKGLRLINNTNRLWVFEFNPQLFSLSETEAFTDSDKSIISDELTMFF